jgi:hypothetical protein
LRYVEDMTNLPSQYKVLIERKDAYGEGSGAFCEITYDALTATSARRQVRAEFGNTVRIITNIRVKNETV